MDPATIRCGCILVYAWYIRIHTCFVAEGAAHFWEKSFLSSATALWPRCDLRDTNGGLLALHLFPSSSFFGLIKMQNTLKLKNELHVGFDFSFKIISCKWGPFYHCLQMVQFLKGCIVLAWNDNSRFSGGVQWRKANIWKSECPLICSAMCP